jgi:hypothetical protein
MDSRIEDEILDLCLDGKHRVDHGGSCAVDGEGAGLDDVTKYDVVHVTPSGNEIGLGSGDADPPIMYSLVGVLFAMKLPEVFVDLGRRAKHVPKHYNPPHLGFNVDGGVVAL